MTGGLKARLVIQQQPQQARMCAMDDAERSIIEPPPIVQMVDEEGRPLVWDFNFMVYVQVRIPAVAHRMFLMMAVSFLAVVCGRNARRVNLSVVHHAACSHHVWHHVLIRFPPSRSLRRAAGLLYL